MEIFQTILTTFNTPKRLIISSLLGLLALGIQVYLISFYGTYLPNYVVIVASLSLIIYFGICAYSIYKASSSSNDLKEVKSHNKNLESLCDDLRIYKHDFDNVLQAMNGYIENEDIPGLKNYFKDLKCDCHKINNMSVLSPDIINNPAIYGLLASKFDKASKYNINMNFEIFIDTNSLSVNTYHLTKMLGILIDNAIDASKECEDKIINIIFRNERNAHFKRQLIIIENTYSDKHIDTEKIFEKGYSTKSKDTNCGIGLWEVRKILSKHSNLNLYTYTDDKLFKQQLEIYL